MIMAAKEAVTKEYIVVKAFFLKGVETSTGDKVQLDEGQAKLVADYIKAGA